MDSNERAAAVSSMTASLPLLGTAAAAAVANEHEKSWITITLTGSTAGNAVAGMTFKATAKSASALATGVGFTMEMLGSVASLGAKYIWGESAASSVRVVAQSAARNTEESVTQTGYATAGVAAAVAGATTALTLTAGTRLVEYSVTYGGKITRDMAEKFSEMYLQYRAMHSGFLESGDVNELIDPEWVMIGETGRQTVVSSAPLPTAAVAADATVTASDPPESSANGAQTTPSKKRKGMVIVHKVPSGTNLSASVAGADSPKSTPKPELKLHTL